MDAWIHIPCFGPWYHVSHKQWKSGASQPPETFQRKARWFSKYLTKIYKSCKVELPVKHAMPSGASIAFWTTTLPVRVPESRTAMLDDWFGKLFPCASKTADFKKNQYVSNMVSAVMKDSDLQGDGGRQRIRRLKRPLR